MPPMNAHDATQAEGTDPIVFIAETEEGNGAVFLDQHYLLGDDMRMQLSNTGPLPYDISNPSLQAGAGNTFLQFYRDIRSQFITSAQEERRLGETLLEEKKEAIRALLKPAQNSTHELSPCFCNEPYADTTAKIDNNSHEPVKMPECQHVFGKCCIVQWLGDNTPSTCPMCRRVVPLPRDEPVTQNETEDGYSIIDYHY
ncbi:hypothetical protein ACHAO8_008744 [Botrytis cinerea]